jgi:uncharacterized protein
LYFQEKGQNYRYEIHHNPWDLYEAEIIELTTDYKFGNISLKRKPDLTHYSPGVKVLAWDKEVL